MTTRRVSGPRRGTKWIRFRALATIVPFGSTGVFVLVDSSSDDSLAESTVTRIVGNIHCRATDAGPFVDIPATLGIITVGERAVLVGATALPAVRIPAQHDWMWWTGNRLEPQGLPTDGSAVEYQRAFPVDIRAQRRFRGGGVDLVLLVANDAVAEQISVSVWMSTLVKLA